MKAIILYVFLALGLTACTDDQQEKIDEINKRNAKKATDYIQKPIDKAKDVKKLTERKVKEFQKSQE